MWSGIFRNPKRLLVKKEIVGGALFLWRAIRPRTGLNQTLSTVYPRVYTRGSPKRNFANFACLINITTENKATNGSDYSTFRAGARTGSGASPSAAETAAIQRGGGGILRKETFLIPAK